MAHIFLGRAEGFRAFVVLQQLQASFLVDCGLNWLCNLRSSGCFVLCRLDSDFQEPVRRSVAKASERKRLALGVVCIWLIWRHPTCTRRDGKSRSECQDRVVGEALEDITGWNKKMSLDGCASVVIALRINVAGWYCTLMVELKANEKLDVAPDLLAKDHGIKG